jgi:hypothetical protein
VRFGKSQNLEILAAFILIGQGQKDFGSDEVALRSLTGSILLCGCKLSGQRGATLTKFILEVSACYDQSFRTDGVSVDACEKRDLQIAGHTTHKLVKL